MNYRRFSPHFIVKSGIHGIGIFTTTIIKKGKALHQLKGKILDHSTRTSIQIGKNKHIEDAMGGFINHSCIPNIKIDRKIPALISLKEIKKGEEITFDYNENEDILACPFECGCCGKKILGKKLILETT